jgi:phosphonate transport system permease protein
MSARSERIESLRRQRPRSRLLRVSLGLLGGFGLYSWLSPDIDLTDSFTTRRWSNLRRFLGEEIVPFPLRDESFDLGRLADWIAERWNEHGAHATLATLQISITAIVLAALLAKVLAPITARTFARPRPFEDTDCPPSRCSCLAWILVRWSARGVAIGLRAIPEYLIAFLALAALGPSSAWPVVLALALHNGGILGRLGGEVIENLEPGSLRALATLGANRRSILLFGIFPLSLSRNLLYFFYRFETCVREATVLGMLGVVSLGYWIQDARARQHYDEMGFLIILGMSLVLLADLASTLARGFLRRG